MRMEEHKAQYRANMSARLDDAFKAVAEDRVVVPNPAQLRHMARAAVQQPGRWFWPKAYPG